MTENYPVDPTEERIRRGQEAARIFENPLMIEAFKAVTDDITARWAATEPGDTAGRERLHAEMRVAHAVYSRLRTVVEHGALAKADVDRRGLIQRTFGKAFRAGPSM